MAKDANMAINGSHTTGEDVIDLGPQAETCCGGDCSGGPECGCAICMGQMDIISGDENQADFLGQGGHDSCNTSEPIDIPCQLFSQFNLQKSFDDASIGSNSFDAPLPTAALTLENLKHINDGYDTRHHLHKWLPRHWLEVDEQPGSHFLSQVKGDHFDIAGTVEAMSMDESMHVDARLSGEAQSMLSTMYETALSRQSGSGGILLRGICGGSLVHRPLRLTEERRGTESGHGRH